VNALYLAPDVETMREAADRLDVRWAILGKAERETYGEREFEASLSMMREAATLRYRVPDDVPRTFVFEFEKHPKESGTADPGS
jgi:hypothetical protein